MNENYYLKEREEEIDIRKLIKILLQNKKIIIIFFIIGFLSSVIFSKIYQSKNTIARTNISFLYNGIKDGLNPDGSRFDINQVSSLKVLNKTYDKYIILSGSEKKQKTLSEFENFINIRPIIPKNISTIIEQKLRNGEDYRYIPKDYIISLKSNLGKEKDIELLNDLIENILREYIKETTPISEITKVNLSILKDKNYLYDDFVLLMENKINQMKMDINSDPKKIKFLNTSLGYSYQDILRNIEIISNVDLEKFKAQIEILNISSDPVKDRVAIKNKVLELQRERDILKQKSETLNQVIKEYKRGEREVILSGDIRTPMSETDKNYYSLIKDLVDTSTTIKEKEVLIEKYNLRLNRLETPTEQENEYLINFLENLIKKLDDEIDNLIKLNNEYYKIEYGMTIQQISPVESVYQGKNIISFIIIGSFIFLVLGATYVLVKEGFKNLDN